MSSTHQHINTSTHQHTINTSTHQHTINTSVHHTTVRLQHTNTAINTAFDSLLKDLSKNLCQSESNALIFSRFGTDGLQDHENSLADTKISAVFKLIKSAGSLRFDNTPGFLS
jgi:hypothetical protein